MIPELRARFNAGFTPEKYADFLRRVEEASGTPIEFRHSETPIFVERSLIDKLVGYGEELIHQLVVSEDYRAKSDAALPPRYAVPNEDAHPLFIQADFGLTAEVEPKLVEIQGFPSLYGYQPVLADAYRGAYKL